MEPERPIRVVDGGGSTTRAALAAGTRLVRRIDGPSCNDVTVGLARASENLASLLARLCDSPPSEGAEFACLALSAASTPDALARFRAAFAPLLEAALPRSCSAYVVTNDIVPLLYDPALPPERVVAICGTGTGYAARDGAGRCARASAREYLLADEGGGFDIGLRGLRAVVRAADRRGGATTLSAALLEWDPRLRTIEALHEAVYAHPAPKELVASFAPFVLRAAAQDDVAAAIVEDAAGEIATGIAAVADVLELGGAPALVLCGSLLTGGEPLLRERVLARLAAADRRRFALVPADADPLTALARFAASVLETSELVESVGRAFPVERLWR